MIGKYVLDNVDQIVLGLEPRPITPTTQQPEIPIKQEKEAYEKELAEQQKSSKAWDRKNARAAAKMIFNIEAGLQKHIEGIKLIAD